MKKIINKVASEERDLVGEFISVEEEVKNLPALSDVEKVQFDHDINISHLYHSSKIEGSKLNEERLEKAIHA